MEVKEITNKQEWERFLATCQHKTFLQSWNWKNFQEQLGKKTWTLGIYDTGLISVFLVVKIKARRGTFLMIEHGPVTNKPSQEIVDVAIEYLKNIAKEEKASFIRVCPIWLKEHSGLFKGFRKAPMHEHPEVSWILDLDKEEEELLRDMRKTTRYLIKQGMKDLDIEVIKSKDINDVDVFNNIYLETGKRHGFVPFSLDYLKNEFNNFVQDDKILIFKGNYKGEVIASSMIVYWQNSGFYHQGASYPSKAPITYLMQWEAIKEAKARGMKHYSFWGIAPTDDKKHPWHGLSLFKRGFGGRREEYVSTQDYIINSGYWKNYIVETFRKIKRGFK
jgi:peptidoglycan pentaglycine glycine transferase (the first glycine)